MYNFSLTLCLKKKLLHLNYFFNKTLINILYLQKKLLLLFFYKIKEQTFKYLFYTTIIKYSFYIMIIIYFAIKINRSIKGKKICIIYNHIKLY